MTKRQPPPTTDLGRPPSAESLSIDWGKCGDLIPAVVQHADHGYVLMVGFMNQEAVEQTLFTRRVTFYSRRRSRLWVKGETSGHFLELVDLDVDCDRDTVLVLAHPRGPVCHRGTNSCFPERLQRRSNWLEALSELVEHRGGERPPISYTARLLEQPVQRIAQKVGEEAIETILAATAADSSAFIDEAADLVYHLIVLLGKLGLPWSDVVQCLANRHRQRNDPSSTADHP